MISTQSQISITTITARFKKKNSFLTYLELANNRDFSSLANNIDTFLAHYTNNFWQFIKVKHGNPIFGSSNLPSLVRLWSCRLMWIK